MKIDAIVLLSGGLDSTVNLYAANSKWEDGVLALTFNYGQKAFVKEREAALYFCNDLSVPLKVIDLSPIFAFDKSALTTDLKSIPTDAVNIESLEISKETAKNVWVSNRNGVLLNVAACVAESMGAKFIVPGFNKEEAATFPDNSVEYISTINESFRYSTSNQVEVFCFTQDLDKIEIMKKAFELKVPTDKIWPCYYAGETRCGHCESCKRFDRALKGVRV